MKKQGIIPGLILIALAFFIVLSACDISIGSFDIGKVPVIRIILGAFFLYLLVSALIKPNIPDMIFPLGFLFITFEEEIAKLISHDGGDIINNWLVLLICFILMIGFNMLLPNALKRGDKCGNYKKGQKYINVDFKEKESETIGGGKNENNRAETSFSSKTVYIDCTDFSYFECSNSFGEMSIFFTNKESYVSDGTLKVNNSFGAMTVHVPSEWNVKVDVSSSMGSVKCPPQKDDEGKVLYIKGALSFGDLKIVED